MEIRGSRTRKLPLTSKRGSAMYILKSQYLKVFAGKELRPLSRLQNLVPKHSFIDKKQIINNPTRIMAVF
jgi:hypothetical protein